MIEINEFIPLVVVTVNTAQVITGVKSFTQPITANRIIKLDKLDYQLIEDATQQSIAYGMYEQRILGTLTIQNGRVYISLQITHSDPNALTESGYTMFSIINNAIKPKFTGTTRNIPLNAVMFAQKVLGYPICWNGAIPIDCFINPNGTRKKYKDAVLQYSQENTEFEWKIHFYLSDCVLQRHFSNASEMRVKEMLLWLKENYSVKEIFNKRENIHMRENQNIREEINNLVTQLRNALEQNNFTNQRLSQFDNEREQNMKDSTSKKKIRSRKEKIKEQSQEIESQSDDEVEERFEEIKRNKNKEEFEKRISDLQTQITQLQQSAKQKENDWNRERDTITSSKQGIEKERITLTKQITIEQETKIQLQKDNQRIEKEKKDTFEQQSREKAEYETSIAKAELEIQSLTEQLKQINNFKQYNKKLTNDLRNATEKQSQFEEATQTTIRKLDKDKNELHERSKKAQKDLQEKETDIEKKKQQYDEEREKLQDDNQTLQVKISQLTRDQQQKERDIASKALDRERERALLQADLQQSVLETKRAKEETENQRRISQEEISELKKQISNELENQRQNWMKQINEMKSALEREANWKTAEYESREKEMISKSTTIMAQQQQEQESQTNSRLTNQLSQLHSEREQVRITAEQIIREILIQKQESEIVFNQKSQSSAAAFSQLAQLITGFAEWFFRSTHVANLQAGAALESASYAKGNNEEEEDGNEQEEGEDIVENAQRRKKRMGKYPKNTIYQLEQTLDKDREIQSEEKDKKEEEDDDEIDGKQKKIRKSRSKSPIIKPIKSPPRSFSPYP
ncbi:MAG: hypothetical protein EZS28_005232 [Streblomastix strix]|uniref:Uncharacterized protein n=1 Tax=Streblomastix strix TaxID=222440 RepID=A0A5J4WW55_9EUKA|nr:MAG: hypothetical protein EZS28_005232 [Streblomastix strix]